MCQVQIPSIIFGTSNTTAMTLGTIPTSLRPARSQTLLCLVQDNGSTGLGRVVIDTSGTMTFDRFSTINNITSFTNSGSKGVPSQTFTYSLD
jgi:hypothetical protein